MPETAAGIRPGTIIDEKWIIIEPIGKGAMGEVFRAHQINLKRDVAIKTISEEMLRELEDDPEETDIAFKRFQREVQAMAQVSHPNILNIFDYGVHTGQGSRGHRPLEYIVMEYVPGDTLRFTMSDEGMDDAPELYARWIESYFLPVLDGVEAMHLHGIYHRDLKPENIFMDGDIPKIADFGLARSHRLKAVSNSMEMKGTLTYMAPEQFSDFRKADQTADIYALGKLLFEALDGKLDNRTLPMKAVRLNKNIDLDIPLLRQMDTVLAKATAENKDQRFQTVAEFRAAVKEALNLATVKDPVPPSAGGGGAVHRHGKAVWIGIVLAFLSVGGMTLWHIWNRLPSFDTLAIKGTPAPSDRTGIVIPEKASDLAPQVLAADGSNMILTGTVPKAGGEANTSRSPGPLFYMDETKISNLLFLEFLNAVKDRITVERGVVSHRGVVLIYLGIDDRQKAPIVYQHQRFHLAAPDAGSRPVTRVTFHGARLYARYYGRTVLTAAEWKFAYAFHRGRRLERLKNAPENETPSADRMMHPLSSSPATTETQGVLDQMGLTVKEWVATQQQEGGENGQPPVAGVLSAEDAVDGHPPALRQQWEGFDDVGFRTKLLVAGGKT